MLMLEGMTAKRASGSQTARQKAAVIKAARLEKEKQIMAALLAGLEALEERSQAEEKLAVAFFSIAAQNSFIALGLEVFAKQHAEVFVVFAKEDSHFFVHSGRYLK